jgi:hypothetical protein
MKEPTMCQSTQLYIPDKKEAIGGNNAVENANFTKKITHLVARHNRQFPGSYCSCKIEKRPSISIYPCILQKPMTAICQKPSLESNRRNLLFNEVGTLTGDG